MGDLKVTIEHGSGLSGLLNAKTVVIGVAVAAMAGSGAASRLVSGLTDLLWWVGGITATAVVVLSAVVIRAMRRGLRQDYVRSIHGPTQRDRELDKMAELRREIALTRAARYNLEVARRMQADIVPDYMLKTAIVEASTHGYGPSEP